MYINIHQSSDLMGLLDLDQVGAHAGHECDSDIDQVDRRQPEEDIKSDEIPSSDAFRSPGTVVVVMLNADIAISAMTGVPRNDHHAS
jgi:hypothetical protein